MRTVPLVGLALILLPAATAARAPGTVEQELAGRTPGQPQQCIQTWRIDSTELFDSGSILYRMKGGPDYLNTPDPKCDAIRHDRQTITSVPSSSLCRGDILRVADLTSHIPYGACPLNDFVPYPRIKKAK
jgi:hypothetical protein